MNGRVIKLSAFILSLFLIVYIGVQTFRFSRDEYQTQTVYEQTVTQSITVRGVFFRDEEVIPLPAGTLSCSESVGSKVAVGTVLGRVYTDASAAGDHFGATVALASLTALKKAEVFATGGDVLKPDTLNHQISLGVRELIAMRDDGDLDGLLDLRESLTEAMAKRSLVLGEAESYAGRITVLEGLAASASDSEEAGGTAVPSTASGYFVDHTDGYESQLTSEALEGMSATDIQNLVAGYTGRQASQSSVKIVTSHRWLYVVTLSEEEMALLSSGGSFSLKFPQLSQPVQVRVASSQREAETGLYKVSLEGSVIAPFFLSTRVQSGDIAIRSYTGIKVPKEALRFDKEGRMGVYVLSKNKMYFRLLDPVYETTDTVLSKTYLSGEGGDYLKLYDTIIVKGKDLYDQKLVE